jgi:hypothetical protein
VTFEKSISTPFLDLRVSTALGLGFLDDLARGANTLKELGLDGDAVDRHSFDLPTVKDKLERAAVNVHEGCGVSIIRGLDPSSHSHEDDLTVFLALSDYIGDVRGVQNRNGDMISGLALFRFLLFLRCLHQSVAES